ncbi:ABC transporter permease [Gryllotalpicola reticulitermitis]|uniref:ABC transporter permease n=1 Tax=Gryllotalpicola reticulitermitis TaxID=1184153 RepID=A0ABV8QD44_9MICO
MRFYLQKIGFYVVALWAAITINFVIPRLMPGNPVDVIIAKMGAAGQAVTPQTRHALEITLGGGGGSLIAQYGQYLANLAHGNLGISIVDYPVKVSTLIAQALPWTIALVGLATVISFVLGVGLGMFAGWKRGSWLDNLIPVTTMFQAVPYFWLALILVLLLTRVVSVFPFAGGYNVNAGLVPGFSLQFVGSATYYGFLPALTIVISSIGGWMLGMRNMMVSTLSEDYIVTAEAKGLRPSRVRMTYAARNAVLPSLSGFAISLGFVVAGSIVTEEVFSYPGIGQLLFEAVSNNDYQLMQGVFLVISLSVLAANLVVDVLYGLIDPRTRARA